MKKIVFVCHGNICRSPAAEFVFKEIIKKARKEREYEVISRATTTEGGGGRIYPPMRDELKKRGIPFDINRRAQKISAREYEENDFVVCMDNRNLQYLDSMFGKPKQGKVYKLLDFTDSPRDVADPYYSDDYEGALNDIIVGCEAFFKYLEK